MNASPGSIYLTRPDVLLRLEALVVLVAGCIAYQHLYPHHWGLFALLFFVPDVSLLGYLRSANKASAAFYNLVHCYVLPLGLGLLAWERGGVLGGQARTHLDGAHQFRPVPGVRPQVSRIVSVYPYSERRRPSGKT